MIKSNVEKALEELQRKKKTALTEIGERVKSKARVNSPVDTGRLRGSIDYQVSDDTVSIGTNVEYAINLEFGTKNQRRQSFLRPARDTTDIEAIVRKWLV